MRKDLVMFHRLTTTLVVLVLLVFSKTGCRVSMSQYANSDDVITHEHEFALPWDDQIQSLGNIFALLEDEMINFIDHLIENTLLESFHNRSISFERGAADIWTNPSQGMWFIVRTQAIRNIILNDHKLYEILLVIYEHGVIDVISIRASSDVASINFTICPSHTSTINYDLNNFRFIMGDDDYGRHGFPSIRDGWYIVIDFALIDKG